MQPARVAESSVACRANLPRVVLNERACCDLELLAMGALSPLKGFLGEADLAGVLAEMRLADGRFWPLPVTLPVTAAQAEGLELGAQVTLCDPRGNVLAWMVVEEKYRWSVAAFAEAIWGTTDTRHPEVADLERLGQWNLAGPLEIRAMAGPNDPAQVRRRLEAFGGAQVLAWSPAGLTHLPEEAAVRAAVVAHQATLLVQPSSGPDRESALERHLRAGCWRVVAETWSGPALLAPIPLASRAGVRREQLARAIIHRNYGADRVLVSDPATLEPWATELGLKWVPQTEHVYMPSGRTYVAAEQAPPGAEVWRMEPSQVRDCLAGGQPLPEWFTRPQLAARMAAVYRPPHQQGCCLWFTGLSGAGKSTLVTGLSQRLLEHLRSSVVLDGDVVRQFLSAGLGFSRVDRDTNVRRIGFVASQVVAAGGLVLCAAISPYRSVRDEVRAMHPEGRFVEIYLEAPFDVCAERDVKGLYRQARAGRLTGLTGVDDPYEPPSDPEIRLDTASLTPAESVEAIVEYLLARAFIKPPE